MGIKRKPSVVSAVFILLLAVGIGSARAQENKELKRLLRLVAGNVKEMDPTLRLIDPQDSILMFGLLESAEPLNIPSNREYVEQWANFQIRKHGILVMDPDRSVVGLPIARLYEMTKYQHFFLSADRILNRTMRDLPRLKDGTITSLIEGQVKIEEIFEIVPFVLRMARISKNTNYTAEALKQLRQIRNLTRDAGSSFSRHAYDAIKKQQSSEIYGKGNAMAAAAMADALSLLPKDSISRAALIPDFVFLMAAAVKYQDQKTGLWHILPTRPETAFDSATTGLFLFALLRGLDQGWLSPGIYAPAARNACAALMDLVDKKGRVMETTGRVNPGKYEDYRLVPIGAFPDGAGAFLLAGAEALKTGFKCK